MKTFLIVLGIGIAALVIWLAWIAYGYWQNWMVNKNEKPPRSDKDGTPED